MEDIAITERRRLAASVARILATHNGQETVLLDLSGMTSWTDFFVVTTATSSTHLRGLLRNVLDETKPLGLDPFRKPQLSDDDEWCLVDFGWIVVHIMSEGARAFYELERLWFQAERLDIPAPASGE
ncbi:MAG: ribosome silencing factor [Spirochaetes bacterium]|nr:ribosome silencing factor [Spirochaetota bacterium]